jgi:hypothetical protein
MRRRKQHMPEPPPTDTAAADTARVYLTPAITFAYGNPPRVYRPGDHLAEDDPILAKVGSSAFYRVVDV